MKNQHGLKGGTHVRRGVRMQGEGTYKPVHSYQLYGETDNDDSASTDHSHDIKTIETHSHDMQSPRIRVDFGTNAAAHVAKLATLSSF